MYVRLAFSVAAHLESEILIVDEVLSVGDAEFQKKCLGKMGSVSQSEGRTVLFVSHNMAAVNALCNKGIYLDKGKIFSQGNIQDILSDYRNVLNNNETNNVFKSNGFLINNFKFVNSKNLNTEIFRTGDALTLKFLVKNNKDKQCKIEFNCEFYDSNEVAIFCLGNEYNNKFLTIKANEQVEISIDFKVNLLPDKYYMKLWFDNLTDYNNIHTDSFFAFEVAYGDFFGTGKQPDRKSTHGLIIPEYEVKYSNL